jgi:hypothetical protein
VREEMRGEKGNRGGTRTVKGREYEEGVREKGRKKKGNRV